MNAMNENTTLLKLIAMVCMIIDHLGAALFPGLLWMRVIGRIAFPLFCWCLAVGAHYTRNIYMYGARLFVLYIVSQPFYNGALSHTWASPNIFMTLLLGLIGIAGIQRKWYWLTIAAIIFSMYTGADYGLRGVVCILLLYALRKHPIALSAAFALFCVEWGVSWSHIVRTPWANIALSWGPASRGMFKIADKMVTLQTLAVMSLPLMLIPARKRTKLPVPDKLLYWVYPAHLAVIWGIKALM